MNIGVYKANNLKLQGFIISIPTDGATNGRLPSTFGPFKARLYAPSQPPISFVYPEFIVIVDCIVVEGPFSKHFIFEQHVSQRTFKRDPPWHKWWPMTNLDMYRLVGRMEGGTLP